MKNKISNRDEWLTHKVKFWIQIFVIAVGVLGAWAMLDKNVALLDQKLTFFETNHLAHIEKNLTDLITDSGEMKGRVISLEIKMDSLLKQLNIK